MIELGSKREVEKEGTKGKSEGRNVGGRKGEGVKGRGRERGN